MRLNENEKGAFAVHDGVHHTCIISVQTNGAHLEAECREIVGWFDDDAAMHEVADTPVFVTMKYDGMFHVGAEYLYGDPDDIMNFYKAISATLVRVCPVGWDLIQDYKLEEKCPLDNLTITRLPADYDMSKMTAEWLEGKS